MATTDRLLSADRPVNSVSGQGAQDALQKSPPKVHLGALTAAIGIFTLLSPFATDMYLSSFPALARDFHTGPGHVQATMTVYVVGVTLGQIVYGPLADRWGRRPLIFLGIGLYTTACLLAPFAPNIDTFIALRALQALGSCSGAVVGRAIVRDLFAGPALGARLSQLAVIQSVGVIFAPIIGSYIFATFGWKANFLFMAALSIATLVGVLVAVPETMDKSRRRSVHPVAVMSTYAELIREREFLFPALCSSAAYAGLFAYICGSPFFFLQLHGLSARQYGWLFALVSVSTVLSAQSNRLLMRRFEPRQILSYALSVHLTAGIGLVLLAPSPSVVPLIVPLWFAIGTITMINANATALAMEPARGRIGSASSVLGALQWSAISLVTLVMGFIQNGAPYPMTTMMAVCGALASLFLLVGRQKARR